jgi:hypothetical protein
MGNAHCEFEDAWRGGHAALWTIVIGILIGSYLAVAV